MQASAAPLQSARRADHLGWFVGLAVFSSLTFVVALFCVCALKWGHPWPPDFIWADNLAMATWALHAPLVFRGLVGTVRAAWHRRFGRGVVWLLFTVWAALVLVGGSFAVVMLVFGGAPSVGDPPGVYNT